MPLDFAALRAKLNNFKGINDRQKALWKPPEGKSIIRIVPWKENTSLPFIELYFHYLGNRTLLSPISFNGKDPIDEFAETLSEPHTKEAFLLARPFRPKLRTYIPVIVRGEEDKGVRFYSFGKTVYEDLGAIMDDEDYGDITDPETGRDVVIEYIPKEKSDTTYPKTTVRAKPNATPLSTNPEQVKQWLTEQPDIREIYKAPSYEELTVVLQRYIDSDVTPEGPKVDPEDVVPSPTAEKAKVGSDPVKAVIAEFDSLFGDKSDKE